MRNVLRNDKDTELLRSELLSIEQLKRHAISLAHEHKIDPNLSADKLLPRLADNARVLNAAYDVVTTAATAGQSMVPAEVWLLDNFYLIEQQILQAKSHLPRGYSRELPKLANGLSAGYPRVYDLAIELISHMDGRLDSDNVSQFIAAYQTVEPLKLGELWAFPIMLQLALLENLRRVGVRIAQRREERDAAVKWADRMLAMAENEPKRLIHLLAEFAHADVPLTAPFVEEFYARLQAQGPAMAFVQTWVEHKLFEQGVTATQLSESAGRVAAANQISIANSFSSLRFIGIMDWKEYVESLSVVEQALRQGDPGVYPAQDFATRDRYRHVIEDIARYSSCSELDVAHACIQLAAEAALTYGAEHRRAHIGFYLVDNGRALMERSVNCRISWKLSARRIIKRCRLSLYLAPVVLLPLISTLVILSGLFRLNVPGWQLGVLALPLLISISALIIPVINQLVTLLLPPRLLPRLDFSKGIPQQHRTMVIVPTLLASTQDVDELIEAIQIRYLGNRDANLFFALLTDFHDAATETLPDDAALVRYASNAVNTLNETYRNEDRPCIFYLFHRPRVWNPYEKIWMGYERKRGKLEQFNARLRGEALTAFSDIVGDTAVLSTIQYVITLDTDTQLPRDAAHALIGNLAHPLNRPVFDAMLGRIVEGYAILQPRASISLASANQSRFSKLFSGESGIDPYTREVSDVYQDIFAEGSFIGKGIYHVDAFRQVTEGRFPENLILSHDLIEGGYARSALITDVDLIESHPASYTQEASRHHRWIRGDWQLSGWLLPSVSAANARQHNPLSTLSKWKLLDNLRRSLVAPSLLVLLVVGWLLNAGAAWFWTLLALTIILLPTVLSTFIALIRKPKQADWLLHLKLTAASTDRPITLALMTLLFLPYDSLINLSAIMQSGLRMLFSKRGLLIWQLPSYARRNQCHSLLDYYREMWIAPLSAIALTAALLSISANNQWLVLVFCGPLLLLWLISPVLAWWLGQSARAKAPHLTADQQTFLRLSARKTWRYFADFVSAEDHWLPPDNVQQYPSMVIASRTSPTNMGMSLLADLAACDFGYITIPESLERIHNTLTTMESLERYRGHFYNWYDTRKLQILPPHYISSVDSGNLAGSLLTLSAGLAEFKNQPIFSARTFQGLQDTFQLFIDSLTASNGKPSALDIQDLDDILQSNSLQQAAMTTGRMASVLDDIKKRTETICEMLSPALDPDSRYWIQAFTEQVTALQDSQQRLLAESPLTGPMPSLHALADRQNKQAVSALNQIDELIHRSQTLAVMDFGFLYDAKAELLTIGFDVTERRRDLACYDLLASEARLASFLLIAQGQVPQKHWFSLGRLLTRHGGDISLISWSGSMFEYLMPQLIMPSYPDTLLDHSSKAAVSRQIQYGRQRSVPWGISESCYNTTDLNQIYQYRAFGVPGLGFKRGLGDDLVIAPYASALALMVMPHEACLNLQTMAEQGFSGDFGFYEAIDYTPLRVPRNKTHAIVQSFMAHHQGMSLLAFAHVLLDQPMQRRFLADPQVRATELLLQERVPKQNATLHPHAAEVSATAKPPIADNRSMMRVFSHDTPVPEAHLLSNGRYHVMATNSGGSYSRWGDLALTRWREDVTADNWGTFIYLRDIDDGQYWSTAYQPTLRKADHYEAIFVQARAEYRRLDAEIEAHTEISVSPEDDVEIRRVTLTNQSDQTRRIEVTSYAEVVLAPLTADMAHRAFSNLFVQTEILADRQAIICTRRPRTAGENVPWMFHLMAAPGAISDKASFETDRSKFIGRGRTTLNPVVLTNHDQAKSTRQRLSNTDGSVLDPIVAIRRTLKLSPDVSTVIQIISGVAESREAALALVDKYCDRHFVERAFEMAWFQSQEVLRHLNITEADAQIYGRLANSVIFGNGLRRVAPTTIARNQLGQSRLWRFAISGDLPIVLLHIGDINRIDLVKQALQAHAYWRMKGLVADLVIINEDFSSYRAELQDRIMALINAGPEAQVLDKSGGVFLRRSDELTQEERVLLQTVARIVFSDVHDTLIEQVDRRVSMTRPSDQLQTTAKPISPPVKALPSRSCIFNNGLGGFTQDGHEYIIKLEPGQTTPAPWVNVIASPYIGTVVSDSGSSYTWVKNAHEFRLTPWLNDPVSDRSGEAIFIRDEASGEFWSPTPLPAGGGSGYICRHGFGYSVFEHNQAEIASELFTYVAMDAAVKFVVVKLTNQSKHSRNLSVTGYWEWVLGEWRHSNLMHIVTEAEPRSGALFARNAYSREYADQIAFVHISEQKQSITANRTEFIGRNGSLTSPAAMTKQQLSGSTGAGLDPCAAIQSKIELAAGQSREIVFIIGAASNEHEIHQLIERFGGPVGARQSLESVWEFWNHTLGTINVETPNPALNVLANGWLVYQTLSCRLWGRSGYYQSGGAFGFRDQLQDTMALIHATPWLAREQIVLCASRQFSKGDVQHWWHPPNGQGVRTHFSDDYLWLPYATCRYVISTGDTGILDEQVHFLEGRELNAEEEAYYDQPQRSAETASVYEHCVRALKHGLRFGAHQLPLMGCGDWNDGMNLVGQHGKGESVWLAWFLFDNLQQFSQLARKFNDAEFAEKCLQQAELLRHNIEENAWDGEWYQRAWFDDGTPLGSASNDECQIDSISQSWSILSKGGDKNRARQAMDAVDKRLVRRDAQLIQLLDPPFDKSDLEPGYIKGYVPGVRENGGQYTHAAIWTTMAFASLGDKTRAWEFYEMLNPVNHGHSAEAIARYKVEPYVMSADIYGASPHTGRGGWTWYTGASGWMYRLTVETLLGINLEDGHLRIAPCVPADWTTFKVHYRYHETLYHITINCHAGHPQQVTRLLLDNVELHSASEVGTHNGRFPVVNDKQVHHVIIELNHS
ncbi:MAG: hypothetical protein JJU48_10785 [Methylophaga sp.]|nr:hypothetical protein [Methylophaga sp.]